MLHPEYAIIGSIDAYTSSQAAIEARRSLAHEEEQSRGLRRKIISGITLKRPREEVSRRRNIVEAMQLTGTSFLTWEEAQTALQATKQIPTMSVNERRQHLQTKFNPLKSEEDKRNLFEKEVRELALKRRLARSALDTNTIERNEDEQTAKMTYWDRQTSSLTNSGPTTRYGETLVSLDTTAELARSFRNEVLGKLKQADTELPDSSDKDYLIQATQEKLIQEFVKKHKKTDVGGIKLGELFGRSSNRYGDAAAFFAGDLRKVQDTDPIVMIKGNAPMDIDSRTTSDKIAAILQKHKVTSGVAIGTAVVATTVFNKQITGAVKKVVSAGPAAPIPLFAGVGAILGGLNRRNEMNRQKKTVMEDLAFADEFATPKPVQSAPQQSGLKKAMGKAMKFLGSQKERTKSVRNIYEDMAIPVDQFIANAPQAKIVNGQIEGLDTGTVDGVTEWNEELEARLKEGRNGNATLRFTRGKVFTQQLLLDNQAKQIKEAQEKEIQGGQSARIATFRKGQTLRTTIRERDEEFDKLKKKETLKGAAVGAGIGTIAGAITYVARHISHELPDTDIKSAAKDPKSLIMKSHTETRQPPDLVEPLFPGTHLQPHSNVPIELISPQHRDPSVQLTAHWSGDRSLGITDPGFRVITPAVQGEKITEHGRQGMHTFLTNDNHIITNGHLDSETAGRLDKLGFKPKEIVDSNFTPNARLGKHGQVDSFKLDSVKWDFNGNRVTLTELDLRPQADVVNNISDHTITTFLQQDKAGHVYFDNLDLLKTPTAGHDHSMYDVLIADKWQERDGKLWAPDISTEYIPMTQTITVNEPKVDNMIALGGMAAIGVAAGIKNRDKIIPIGEARKQRKEQERAKKQLETDKQMEERMNWDIASKLDPDRPAVLSPDEIHALRVQQIDAFAQTINPSIPPMAQIEAKPFEEQHPIWNGFFMEANPYQNRIPIIQNRPHQISLYDVLHITDPLNPDPTKMPKEYVIALLSKLAAADQEFQNTQKVANFDRLLTDIQGQGYEVEFEFQPNLQPGSVDLANHLITLNLSEKPANLFYYLRELLQLFQQAAA